MRFFIFFLFRSSGENMIKILLLEDEPAIADTVIFALQKENFECIHTSTITESWDVFEKEQIDFAILDIGLPDGNGVDFCRELRNKGNTVPIIFLTARDEEIDRIVGLEVGGDDYLTKPFSPRELVTRVKVIQRRLHAYASASKEPSPHLVAGEFQIDKDKHVVHLNQSELKLTRNEYGLLVFLVENSTKVFTRQQLMEAVWEEPASSLERTVDAHIKSIRKKISEIDTSREYIITHRGFGYSLSSK